MRSHIDYAIHLNSSFLQFARMENGVPVILKTDTMKESMPLFVAFNKRQDVLVGDTAYNLYKNDYVRALKAFDKGKSNVFNGFTRTLGTKHTYFSSNTDRSYTSEELLAECFKKLKSFVQDENIQSVVITIPDKFLNPQCQAIVKAGQLAGFKQIRLVQETIAIMLAYPTIEGYYLLFDFGKEEFKTSLCRVKDSEVSILDNDGDSWLGGCNVDEAIVDQIIIPNLQANYAIDSILEDNSKKENLRGAIRYFAKEAKKRLSFNDTYDIISDVGYLPFEDDNDEFLDIDIKITQQKLAWITRPIYQKAIDISVNLLKRNNIKGWDLENICLVGGDTFSPILRQMLKEQITKNIDTTIDPLTVVARGAALFASIITVSDEVKEESRDKTKLQLDIKYEATTVELDEMVNIKVLKEKTEGIFPEEIYVDVVRSDGAWSSGKKQISEKASILEVVLAESQSNVFDVNVYDEIGNKLECQPNQFTIIQGIDKLDGMQVLPYHIGIGRYFKSEGKELFMPIKGLEKNKRLPATGVINGFKTDFDLRPGVSKDIIRFPLYQGDYGAERTDLSSNNYIFDVIISGETLPAFLPKGSDINIIVKVDKSQLMTVILEIPYINHTEEAVIEIKQTEPISAQYVDKMKGELVLFYADNPAMGKEQFRYLLKELMRVEKEGIGQDERMKIIDLVKREFIKWQ